jgi:anti-anti-sigma factor
VAQLTYETTVSGGVAVVALAGELDLAGATRLEDELERLEASDAVRALVLDLRGLEFLDSSGLRLVVLADQRARDAGRRLALVPGREAVQRIFDITRMAERLTFVPHANALKGDGAP